MDQERIIELAVKKLRGTLTPEEAVELEAFEQKASAEERARVDKALEYERRLVRVLRLMRMAEPNYETNRKKLVYPSEEGRGTLRRIWVVPGVRRFVAVAAVFLVFLAGAAVWKKLASKKAPVDMANTAQSSPIRPVSNKAVLVLADGRSVILDSTADGKVAMEGGTVITKDADGKLSYQPLSNTAAVGFNTVNTPQGGQYFVELPDRTRVWLNAASSIRFPTAFSGEVRVVTITGEAYLEVAKDQTHPFVVKLGETSVRVLGTHFNVRDYPEDGPASTTLLEGSVQVGANGTVMTIKPGQAAITTPDGIRVNPWADTTLAVAWKNGQLNFSGAGIKTIMNTIKRWYDVDVVYEGKLSEYSVEGIIPKDTDIEVVLEIMRKAGYHLRLDRKTIHVLP